MRAPTGFAIHHLVCAKFGRVRAIRGYSLSHTLRVCQPLTAAVPFVRFADISPHCGESPSGRERYKVFDFSAPTGWARYRWFVRNSTLLGRTWKSAPTGAGNNLCVAPQSLCRFFSPSVIFLRKMPPPSSEGGFFGRAMHAPTEFANRLTHHN